MIHQEEKIIRYLKEKNAECVKMIFDNYYQVLCLFALRFVHSFEDAEDVVQEVLVNFWEKKRGTVFEGSLKSYLFGAVQKEALYMIRQSGRLIFEEIGNYSDVLLDEVSVEREEDINARREKLRKEIQLLPEKCREVFIAIVLEGLSYKEVADKLGVSVNTVKTHYARALKQLRDNLDTIILLILLRLRKLVVS